MATWDTTWELNARLSTINIRNLEQGKDNKPQSPAPPEILAHKLAGWCLWLQEALPTDGKSPRVWVKLSVPGKEQPLLASKHDMSACTAEPIPEGPQALDPSQEARNLRVTLGLLKHRCLFPGPPQAHHWASTAAATSGHSSFDPFQVSPGVPLRPSALSLSSLYPSTRTPLRTARERGLQAPGDMCRPICSSER